MTHYGICFTYNNYTTEDILRIQGCVGQRGITYICYGREVGENGTPHLQGYLQSTMKNFQRLQMATGRCHMEAAKGSDTEAITYCQKDGDFWEGGERMEIKGRKERQGQRNDLEAVKNAIERGETYDDICDTQFETAARYSKFIKERVQARDSTKQLDSLKERFASSVLKPWQRDLMDVVTEEACPRKIHWLWETQGNVGKSYMASYLGALHGATVLTAGKKVDLAYIYAQKPTKIVLFDLSRTTETSEDSRKHYLDGIYSLAEDLKNGRIVSTKYESKTVFFPPPHVIFFANFEPDYTKWSEDRYFVTKL